MYIVTNLITIHTAQENILKQSIYNVTLKQCL